jgi:carbon storage regulator CsrA
MLVLSRKSKEEIQIGDDIKITVLRIKGHSVSIGIDAPGKMRILRGELPSSSAWDGGERLAEAPLGWPVRSGRKATDGVRKGSQRGEMFQQDPANFHDGAGVSVHA